MKVLVCWAGCQIRCTGFTVDFDTLVLLELVFMSSQIIHHLCVVISAHLALPMTRWHLWLYVAEAVRLFALG